MNAAGFKWILITVAGLLLLFAANVTAEELPKGDCNAPEPLTDLRHCVFWNRSFSGTDLHGVLLDGVSLRSTNLRVNRNWCGQFS